MQWLVQKRFLCFLLRFVHLSANRKKTQYSFVLDLLFGETRLYYPVTSRYPQGFHAKV